MTPDHELDSLREKRKRELLAQNIKKELAIKKKEEEALKQKNRQAKAAEIVNKVLEPEAVIYLNWLTKSNPAVALTIKDTIILLIQKNMLRKQLSKIDIMKIERELTGKDSKIQVKRRGKEITDLNENFKSKE
ncbi:MAG: hypothetical protein FK732_06090 [Asgard group archaeon]|nr:hypothetical protein [Asgard group archaeon]